MFENTVLRKQPILWGLRFAQAVIAIVALGITGSDAAGWHDLGCGTPAKVAYNISAAALTLPGLLYLVLTTGMFHLNLPWSQWVQLPIDAVYLVLWIAAVGTSTWMTSDCDNLCEVCSGPGAVLDSGTGYSVFNSELTCSCALASDYKRAKRDLRPRDAEVALGGAPLAARQAFDAIMLVLFLITTAGTLFFIIRGRQSGAANSCAGQREAENPVVEPAMAQAPQKENTRHEMSG